MQSGIRAQGNLDAHDRGGRRPLSGARCRERGARLVRSTRGLCLRRDSNKVSRGALRELWSERGLLGPAFAGAIGVGYLPLLVLPWTFGALVTRAGYSESKAGWIATLEVGALAVTSLLAAGRATRAGRRAFATAATVLTIVANAVAIIVAPGSALFLVARLCSGVGLGVAVAVGNATAANSKNPTRAFAALWFLMASWQLLIFNATPWIIDRLGLSGAYGMIAGVCVLFLPLIVSTPDPDIGLVEVQSSAKSQGMLGLLPIAILAAFLMFWLRDALVFSMSERLAASVGIDGRLLGVVLGVASVIGLVGPVLATRLGAGATSHKLVDGALVLTLAVSVVMALGVSAAAFTTATLIMPGIGLFAASLLSGLASEADPTGRLPAIGAGVGFMSEAVGPALGGALIEWHGQHALTIAVIVVGVVTIVAASVAARNTRSLRGETSVTAVPAQTLN